MLRIKRTKNPPPPATTPPAVHYATGVAKAGNITGWTADIAKAGEFHEAVADAVKTYYRLRENVGDLTFDAIAPVIPEPVIPPTPEPVVLPTPIPEPVPTPVTKQPPTHQERAGRKASR